MLFETSGSSNPTTSTAGWVEYPKDISGVLSKQLLLNRTLDDFSSLWGQLWVLLKNLAKETGISVSQPVGHCLGMFIVPKAAQKRNKNLPRSELRKNGSSPRTKPQEAGGILASQKWGFYLVAQRELEKRVREKDSVWGEQTQEKRQYWKSVKDLNFCFGL